MLAALCTALLCGPIPAPPPTGSAAMAPSLCPTDSGAWLTWLAPAQSHGTMTLHAAFRPHGADTAWGDPQVITRRGDFFANWADVPRLGVAKDGTRYATWLQQSGPGTFAYDIGLARAEAGGDWVHMGTLNDDRILGEHGFVSLLPASDTGGVRAFWLDGRAMSGEGHGGHGGGDMMLRTALVTDRVHDSAALDSRVCECCPTDAAALPLGPAVVVRDRGPEEERDIAIVRQVEDTWSRPMPVSIDEWRINGCPVNGPRIAADGARVAVLWYSAGGAHPGLRLAWSTDGGATFASSHAIDDAAASGRPALALLNDGAMVIWLDQDDHGQWLQAAVVDHSGRVGPIELLARVPEGRRAGVPQIAALGDHILVIWTARDRNKGLDGLLLPVASFPRPAGPR